MKNFKFLLLLTISLCNLLLFAQKKDSDENEKIVLIKTEYGNMKVRLYNKTPLHRDNFIKLASKGYYNGTLFHRVINGFMIQGGDPDSKDAAANVMLGNGGPDYTIPAEFVPEYYHKKGAIAAAREPDNVNPEKRSSGSQFYIVQGTVLTKEPLTIMENRRTKAQKDQLIKDFLNRKENKAYKDRYDKLIAEGTQPGIQNELKSFFDEIMPMIEVEYNEMPEFTYPEEQANTYMTIGGTPHLDGSYTVFGEVIEGLDVIDKIAAVKTNIRMGNRPIKDIPMTVEVLR